MEDTYTLSQYYPGLLIIEYATKPKAYGMVRTNTVPFLMPQVSVQEIEFLVPPSSGSFKLSYDGVVTSTLNWNSSAGAVQTALRAIPGLEDVVVTGSSAGSFIITFEGVSAPAYILEVVDSTLDNPATVTETDLIIPLAVQNAFNLIGNDTAVGVQLDVLGKYMGVSRTSRGVFGQVVVLNDLDFLMLIRFAILINTAQSDLATIQTLVHQIFPGQMQVFDYQDMRMSYIISSVIGSQDLIQAVLSEGLLPRPMAVQISSVIYVPDIASVFGFSTYEQPAYNTTPFNDYADYHTDWRWLTYTDAVII